MTVHRIAKYQIDDPFTRVPNVAVNDDRLDLKARGLLLVMLSKPDGWQFRERSLARDCGVGRDQIRSTLARLAEAGYVHRFYESGDDGMPVMVTEVYDTPIGDAGRETRPTRGSGFPTDGISHRRETRPPSNNGVPVTNEGSATKDTPSPPGDRVCEQQALVPDDTEDSPAGETPADVDAQFERCWQAYPKRRGKRVGKKQAREKWRKLPADDRAQIAVAIDHYAAACDRGDTIAKDMVRFIAPTNRFWEDWLAPPDTSDPSSGAVHSGRPAYSNSMWDGHEPGRF